MCHFQNNVQNSKADISLSTLEREKAVNTIESVNTVKTHTDAHVDAIAESPFAERTESTRRRLPELCELDRWAATPSDMYRVSVLEHVDVEGEKLPLYCFEMGAKDPTKPTVVYLGGVHGIERIGTQVLLSYMHTLFQQLEWDHSLINLLKSVRILFVPLVNPGGMLQKTRCNPRGVDLMRNAPVDAEGRVSFMVGGQSVSKRLPWYRGDQAQMEPESQAVVTLIESISSQSECLITLDCHSGFGRIDRIWFPYAKSLEPFEDVADIYAMRLLFRRTHPNFSFYRIEPQALNYTTHGDLWDYLYMKQLNERQGLFLPLTLEMGSWMWVKKNPRQIFGALGMFNPVMPHRQERVLRRHQTLFDFLLRAAKAHLAWRPNAHDYGEWQQRALDYWYDV